jgi:hypothetical protein
VTKLQGKGKLESEGIVARYKYKSTQAASTPRTPLHHRPSLTPHGGSVVAQGRASTPLHCGWSLVGMREKISGLIHGKGSLAMSSPRVWHSAPPASAFHGCHSARAGAAENVNGCVVSVLSAGSSCIVRGDCTRVPLPGHPAEG